MSEAASNGGVTAIRVGEFRIEAELTPGSYRAIDATGRQVVLKMLDAECLWREQLHPLIKDRMARVMELPDLSVANVQGVQRAEGRVFVVWEYVEGITLAEYAARCSRSELIRVAKELVSALEALHRLGIVHGAVHGRNVIVTPRGQVKLTHVSPLLYDESETDVASVIEVLESVGLGVAVDGQVHRPLRQIAHELEMIGTSLPAATLDAGQPHLTSDEQRAERRLRRRGLTGAVIAAAVGAVVAWTVWWMASRG